MTTLNPDQIKQHDSEDMLELLSSFSDQCKHGWEIGEALKLEGYDKQIPNNIVIAGMGGSGIGGDLVKAVVGGQVPCPIIVHRGVHPSCVCDISNAFHRCQLFRQY